jgi:sialidase-1
MPSGTGGVAECQTSVLLRAEDAGYCTFRIPALAVTPAGTVLAFAEARRHTGADDDEIHLVLRRSLDGGQSWLPLQVLFQDGGRSVNQPTPVVDRRTGAVLLLFCKDNRQVFTSWSRDEGCSWSAPAEITASVVDPGWAYVGCGPGHGLQLSTGRLLVSAWGDLTPGAFCVRRDGDIVQFSYAFYSDDDGASWRRGNRLEEDLSDECMAVETADGAVYLDMRSRQGRRCRAHAWSWDGGHSWSAVQFDEGLPEPSCQGSIVRVRAPRAGEPGLVLMAHPADRQRRQQLTLLLSRDECVTWQAARVLCPGYAGYSDLAVTAGGSILCLYETDACQVLTVARMGLDWLLGGHR